MRSFCLICDKKKKLNDAGLCWHCQATIERRECRSKLLQAALEKCVQNSYTESGTIEYVRRLNAFGLSLREIAKYMYYGEINHADVQRILNGHLPRDPEKRRVLGLQEMVKVTPVNGRPIPAGAQVLMAQFCECGRAFISNHPRRRKCFVCSPYRGGKQ